MSEARRQDIRNRINAAHERDAARDTTFLEDASDLAADAREKFTSFAREHPLTVIGGGLIAGVLISALFKKSPTRKLGGKAAGLAALGAEVALGYVQQAMGAADDARRAGTEKLEDLGTTIGETSRSAARKAGKRISEKIRATIE